MSWRECLDARGELDPAAAALARSAGDVLGACDAALACLEIVDSVWAGYRFTLEDNTADGSSAAWVVAGPPLPLEDLASLPVVLSVDGRDLVITGGLTSARPLEPGHRVSAVFGDGRWSVEVRRTPSRA